MQDTYALGLQDTGEALKSDVLVAADEIGSRLDHLDQLSLLVGPGTGADQSEVGHRCYHPILEIGELTILGCLH